MWLEGKNALKHRVYFGTNSGNLSLLGTQTNNIFNPGLLDENTEYFWRIDTITADGIITGDEWSFTPKKSKPGTLTSIFYPTEDTYVDSDKPDVNFGGGLSLNLTTPTKDITREAYIKFNPQVDGDIVAATLRLGADRNIDFGIYPVADNSWQEDTMTWNPPNSPPAMGDLPIALKPDLNDGWFVADVSTYFTENGTKSIGLVRAPKSNVRSIQSSESATPPELIIEYIIPTSQTNHSPYFHANTFASTEATANIKYSGDISSEATDPDLDQVIFSKAAGPSWLIVNPDGTLSGTPLPVDVGANSFTMRVTDPSAEFHDGLMSIKVLPVNNVPTISDVPGDGSMPEGVGISYLVTVGDEETAAADLTLSASSSNTVLMPDANIVLGGSGASRHVSVIGASGQSGSTTITLTVSDGTDSASDTFVLTVVGQETTETQTLSLNAGWN
ncbi:MAG TPA: DNRLRE domain-containing protein, partial [Gammaproteobacteria bacterium]|nr:DNRLRE domain-containing protein [Gammaproteobacteria bacterium]